MLKKLLLTFCITVSFCSANARTDNVAQYDLLFENDHDTKLDQTLKFASQVKLELSTLDKLYQIHTTTYEYLDGIFSDFYHSVSFNTDITNSTFEESQYYEMLAIPLAPENTLGLQFEVFGQFSNSSNQYLSNMSAEMVHFHYQPNEITFEDSELNLGLGFSFKTSPATKIKVIISDGELPGYGSSKTILGFESIF